MAFFSASAAAAAAASGAGVFGSTVAGITATVAGSFLLNTTASLALSALANKIAKNQQGGPAFSVRTQMGRGAGIPQSFGVGKFATAGSLSYVNTGGGGHSPNAPLRWVISLSDLPISSLDAVWVNGVRRTLGTAGADGKQPISGFSKGGNDFLMAQFYDGTQTAAEAELVTAYSGSSNRPYENTAIGTGTAYAFMFAYIEQDLFRNGIPQLMFECTGIPLYDISKDTTAGGSGAHRWSDPATWESSENPAVIIYNLLRGIQYDGAWFYGLQGVTASQLPAAHWIAEIQACDELVDADGATQEPRYRASGEIPVSAQVSEVIRGFMNACNGRLSDAGGVYKLFVGDARSSVATFSDSDILSTSEQSFTPFFGLADSINGISGTYPSPAAGWQVETAPPIFNSDFETEDGSRRLLADVSFDFVPYPEQVQRLMKAALAEARRARRHTITLGPEFWALEPGDVVTWTSERNGYVSKQFRVDGVIDTVGADVILDLTEIDPADYDFDTDTDFTTPANSGILAEVIDSQSVPGFAVSATTITDENGDDRRPAILAEWDDVDDDVKAVKFQVRVQATGDVIAKVSDDTPSDLSHIISEGILPATAYQVRAQFVVRPYRPVEWSAWEIVTTGAVRLSSDDLDSAVNAQLNAADTALSDLGDLTAGFVGNLVDNFASEATARNAQIVTSEATLRAEFNSAASFLSVKDFADGSGDWEPTDHTIVTSTTPSLPSGITHALRMDDQSVWDGGLRTDAGMAERVLEWTGWVLAEDATGDAIVRIRTQRADGTTIDTADVTVRDAGDAGWTQFKAQITLPSDVAKWHPVLRSSVSGATQNIYWANMDLRDVSGIAEALISANAYTDQEVVALSGPGGAITAVSDQLGVEVTQLRSESDGLNVILDDLSELFENNSTTMSGAAAVGQADTAIITESAGARVTSGDTNGGAVIEIPEEKARQFSGRRIKISILAKEPSSNPATRFGIAYSTADAGNSGYLQADADLSGSFEWFYFFVNVPTAGNGGPDYLGIFGDDDQNGDGTQVARVNIQIAAEAADLPEIATLQGDIVDIKGLDASALTGTVFGTFLEQMDVAANGVVAGITNFGAAMADLDGNASAALVMRTKAGGAAGEIEIVSFDNANGGAAYSQVKLSGDTVLLSGETVLIGDYRNLLYGSTGTWENHGWALAAGASIETWGSAKSGGKVLLLDETHSQSFFGKEYEVLPGDEFRLHFWARPATNVVDQTNGSNRIQIETQDSTGSWTHLIGENWETDALGSWTEHDRSFAIPDGAVKMRISIDTGHTAGDVRLDDLRLQKKAGADLIIDGGLRSIDFVTGVSGWMIAPDGNAEFNQLIVRESLVDGSVSDGGVFLFPLEYGANWFNLSENFVSPVDNLTDATGFVVCLTGQYRASSGKTITNATITQMTFRFSIGYKEYVDGVWYDGESVVGSVFGTDVSGNSAGSTSSWKRFSVSGIVGTTGTQLEFFVVPQAVRPDGFTYPTDRPNSNTFKDLRLSIRGVVR